MDYNKYSNANGYYKGTKITNGKDTGIPAHVFFVTKKEDTPGIPIPKEIKGVPTDVVEIGHIKPLLLQPASPSTMQKTITPLRGGIQINGELMGDGVGTLGGIVKDRVTGKLLGVTNAHVANNPVWNHSLPEHGIVGTAAGTDIYQATVASGNFAGKVFKDHPRDFYHDNLYDISFFEISPEVGVTVGIMGLTKYPQTFISPSLGDVVKAGISSSVTFGTVVGTSVSVTQEDPIGDVVFREQIYIKSPNSFSIPGDSGSLVCVDLGTGRVGAIGVLHSGGQNQAGEWTAFASRIDLIAADFDILPWDGTIILSKDEGMYAALNDGTLYGRNGMVCLNETNSHVCFSGDYNEVIMNSCYAGSFSVNDGEHVLKSYDHLNKYSDIRLDTEIIYVTGEIDTDVDVSIDCEASGGGIIDTNVDVGIGVDNTAIICFGYSPEIDVNVEASVESETAVGAGVDSSSDIDVFVETLLSGDTAIMIGCSNEITIDVMSIIDSDIIVALGNEAEAEIDVPVEMSVEATSVVDSISYGTSPGNIGACDGENHPSLAYGA